MGINKSRPVLVTGCSTGIGRETAEMLAREGWNVYATARKPETLEDLKASGAKTLALDVTDEGSMCDAVDAIEQEQGAIGALINNAGYSQSGAIETIPLESVRRQFETNVFGLVRMCQLVLPKMREAGEGMIINISSMGGKLTFPGGGIYHGTKHSVEAISDALRFEVSKFGVNVVVIEPGLVKTSFGDTAAGSLGDAREEGPYAKFNEAVGTATASAYEGTTFKFLGGGPDAVAKAIEKALSARRPRARYKVTPSARVIMGQRSLLTDRGWDRFVGTQFPHPKPGD
ncbi:MAG: SDR family NAD(P)-dependent oxidoreductase [Solirubrobacterales bacterium]|nr:SDR family NAD(P)-dependent oxidoreductase [Solirubrobacterales bacterium]